jgi:hypothetical protein
VTLPAFMKRRCSWEGCQRIHAAHGFCQMHYAMVRHSARLEHLLPEGSRMPRCEIPGCDNPRYAKGVCIGHYHTPRSRNYTAEPLNPQRVRVLLAVREASITDLARHLGVSRQRVSRLLDGRRIKEESAHKMADFFGVGVDYLIDPEPLTLKDLNPSP